ncbi:MAG: GGDEF domain-containing protein [Chloroflexota bacterium]
MAERAGSLLRGLFRRPVTLAFIALAAVEFVRLLLEPSLIDLVALALVGVAGAITVWEHEREVLLDGSRRGEAESFARILRGLSRSVSPDAIVDAIVEELGAGTGADHVAVVRRRPETRNLEAILSPTRPGAAASRTTLPLRELEDPAAEQAVVEVAITASRGRPLTAIPVVPDARVDPHLGSLGISPDDWVAPAASGPVPVLREWTGAGLATRSAPRPRRPHAGPGRDGADQRIADRIARRLQDAYGLRNLRAAPLRVNGRVEGAIVLSRRTNAPWPESAGRLLEAAAVETSAALARVYSMRDAEARATTDALTGLPNRRYFDEYLGLLSRRRRAEDRVGVLMVDIDRFKLLNDTFGHAVGDHVLREVAQAIAGAVREGDVPVRFGGEEFAVLLRNPSLEIAVEVGERVRRSVSSLDLARMGVPGVSVSVGVAVAEEADIPLDVVIDEADQALYRAKRGGRDRVVAA